MGNTYLHKCGKDKASTVGGMIVTHPVEVIRINDELVIG